jgi:nitrate/nitrite-specific signal transduction histidine kinase
MHPLLFFSKPCPVRLYGIAGIIERAKHIGAQIQITPKLGEGVKVRIVLNKNQPVISQ